MVRTLTELTSAALIVAGIGFVYWPAALVTAGVFGLVAMRPAKPVASE